MMLSKRSLKSLLIEGFVFLFIIVVIVQAVEIRNYDQVYQKYVDIEQTPPKTYSYDCWAACIKLILSYYGMKVSEHNILQAGTLLVDDGICTWSDNEDGDCNGTCNKDVKTIFQDYGLGTYSGRQSEINPRDIVNQINGHRPIYCGWCRWDKESGHAVVIVGYKITATTPQGVVTDIDVILWDPTDGKYPLSYTTFYSGTIFYLDKFLEFNTSGNSCPNLPKRAASPLGL